MKVVIKEKRILKRITRYLFTKKVTIFKWQLNMLSVISILIGTVIGGVGIIPRIFALNESEFNIQQGGNSDFTLGDSVNVTASSNSLSLTKDSSWYSLNWGYKKVLTIKNINSTTIKQTSAVTISVDTSSLESVLANCNDIRVIYQNVTDLPVTVVKESTATNCSDSKATKITFPLQADILTNASDSTNYALYYGNPSASSPSSTDGYSIPGGPTATIVCPFDGTTTCTTGQTPTSANGAIRFSGSKSALAFDGFNDYVSTGLSPNTIIGNGSSTFTIEGQFKATVNFLGYSDLDIIGGNGTTNGCGNTSSIIYMYRGVLYFGLPHSATDGCQSTTSVSFGNVNTDTWYHFAATYDSATKTMKTYLNGIYVSQAVYGGSSTITWNSNFEIGRSSASAGKYFTGALDELRVSDNLRYTSNFTPSVSPLVSDSNTKLLYHFDENGDDIRAPSRIFDSSANSYHGSASGARFIAGLVGIDKDANYTSNIKTQTYASHQGLIVEEGTINLIKNPSFENGTYNTNWSSNYINYGSSTPTFTPNMSKRNSAGPFAAGPIVQGHYDGTTSDTITIGSTNTQISGNFYSFNDWNQGSIVFWYTPERVPVSSTRIVGNATAGQPMITADSTSVSLTPGGMGFVAVSKSLTWTPGNTYLIVARWNVISPIDGINYASISVDNVHTFGRTSTWSPDTQNFTIGTTLNSANGIIEGLTIYRRVLFDGTYGTNVSNGNELTQIYNSGTGKDPTLITGSWDVVFALPTNASTGTLTTGTGNAWSHPHLSNLLYTSTANTGGFMMNGTYGTDGFVDIGSPSNVGALSTSEKIFGGGYKYTSTGANQGIYRSFTATNGGDYVLRALGNSDGTCNPQVKITRADGTTEISHLNGTTTSTKGSPDVYIFTWESPAAESNQIQLINTASSGTCYWHQVEVLNNLIDNPSLEGGAGNPWIPTGWTNGNAGSGDLTQELTTKYSGSSSIKINSTFSNRAISTNTFTGLSSGDFVDLGGWVSKSSGGLYIDGNDNNIYQQNVTSISGQDPYITGVASWTLGKTVGRVGVTSPRLRIVGDSSPTGYIDDVYAVSLPSVTLTITPASQVNSTESSGLRVDGSDTVTQASTLESTNGVIKFKFTPRHSYSIADKFGMTQPTIIKAVGDANNYLQLYYQSSTVLRLQGMFNGQSLLADYNSPILNAGTTYDLEISYKTGDSLILKVNGGLVSTVSSPLPFSVVPTTIYFGSDGSGTNQYDATYTNSISLTPTLNTSSQFIKFGSNSVKLVNSGGIVDEYTSNFTPGTTYSQNSVYYGSRQNLSAYVYDGTSGNSGGPVTNTVANLYFNNAALTTDYQDMGEGWYRLSSVITVPSVISYPTTNIDTDQGLYVDSNTKALSQAFKVPEDITLANYSLNLKKVGAGTPTTTYYRVTIETDNLGLPSGTVVTNSTSVCNSITNSGTYTPVIFYSNNAVLTANTQYHLVLKPYTNSNCSVSQASADATNYISWGYDNSSSNFVLGDKEIYNGTSWSTDTGKDHSFSLMSYGHKLKYGVQVLPGKTVYIDGVQLEQKLFATSYADGSLGTGYGWDADCLGNTSDNGGVANDSCSIRYFETENSYNYARGNYIKYDSSAVNRDLYTISIWLKPIIDYRKDTSDYGWGRNHCFFSMVDNANKVNGLCINAGNGSTNANMYTYIEGGSNRPTGITYGITTDWREKWQHIVWSFDLNGSHSLYVNNSLVNTVSNVGKTNLTPLQYMTVGNLNPFLNYGSGGVDAVISDFRVFNQALNANQVSDLYKQGIVTLSPQSNSTIKYNTSGTWESPIINLGQVGGWGLNPNFVTTETLNGNTVGYETKTSTDGLNWSSYQSTQTGNIQSSPNRYIQLKATLNSSTQNTTPVVSGISVHYVQDVTPPPINADNIVMKTNLNGRIVSNTGWNNNPSPYFQWDLASDEAQGSGIKGYCLSLSQNIGEDPATSKGLLGTSPVSTTNTTCQFINSSNTIDFSDINLRGNTWLSASNNLYYLSIKAIDNTGNIFPTSEVFEFKYDDIPPTNVTSFSAPQNSFSNVNDIYFNWPISGTGIASDGTSGLLGYQYSINNETTWIGNINDPSLNLDYIPVNESLPFYLDTQRDAQYIQMGTNIIYFRALDSAGNRSSISRTVSVSYGGDAPTFPDGSSITISPTVSTTNMFNISWPAASASGGRTIKTYYYMINTTLPSTLATILNNSSIYIPTTSLSIPESALPGVVKGSNSIYVVAIDNLNNYSAGNALSASFTLDTNLPDPVTNLTVSDASVKSSNLWRASLAWNEPVYKGTGILTYKVYRSENNTDWVYIAETLGTAYVDTVAQSKKYYWKIGVSDNTDDSKLNQTFSLSVNLTPKGSYTVPAPIIGEVKVTETTTKRATISWNTSRNSDSRVAYGLTSKEYFPDEIANSKQVTEHLNILTNLQPATMYYYKALWTDEDGNIGESLEQTFVTEPAPEVKEVSMNYINTTSAQLNFKTKKTSKVKIYYGKTTLFGSLLEVSTSIAESKYTIMLDGLDDGTKYYYRINPFDSENTEYEGTILDFNTIPKPRISDIKIQQIRNTSQTSILVSWNSNTEISSILSYYPENKYSELRDQAILSLVKGEHKITLNGLIPDTSYILFVKGYDKQGNEAISSEQKFTTATDTRSPKISEVLVETYPGEVDNGSGKKNSQIIVSWKTDEPATSRVEYGEGNTEIYEFKTPEDDNLKLNHVVIINNLDISKIYHLRAISLDKAKNESKSQDVVTITAKTQDNAFDLIFKNIRNIFNF